MGVWQSMAGKPNDQATFVHDGLAAAATTIPELRSLYALHSLSAAPGKAEKGIDALAAHLATTSEPQLGCWGNVFNPFDTPSP